MKKKIALISAMLTLLAMGTFALAAPANCEECYAWLLSGGVPCDFVQSYCYSKYGFDSVCPTTCNL